MTQDPTATARFLIGQDRLKEARTVLDFIYPYATTIEQLDLIGSIYAQAKGWDRCAEIAQRLCSMLSEPQKSLARCSLISAYLNLNLPKEAMLLIEEQDKLNIDLDEDHAHNLALQRTMALFMLNKKDDSFEYLKKLTGKTTRQSNEIKFNMAIHRIANGNFQEGLKDFILTGRDLGIWRKCRLDPKNEWKGEVLTPGETLLIVAEGGIGDEIINFRFCENLKKMGVEPVWYTDRTDLANVFRRHGVKCVNIPMLNTKWTYSMSLPIWLEVKEDELWYGPYLTSLHRQPKTADFEIGIRSEGNPEYEHNLHRTVPLNDITNAILAKAPNLNKDIVMWDFNEDGSLWDTIRSDWEITLDYIDKMDIVITSCTSIAHASAAMGKKTLVFVPIMNYYLWAKPGNSSPWYGDNVVLFRQTKPNCWQQPIQEMVKYLETHY